MRAWGDGLRGDLFSRTDCLGEELVQMQRHGRARKWFLQGDEWFHAAGSEHTTEQHE